MKRKFYYLFPMLLMAAMSVGFISCGSDDDEPAGKNPSGGDDSPVEISVANLIGTWQLTRTEEYDKDGTLEEAGSSEEPIYLHFSADGTATEYERDGNSWWVDSFTYTLSGKYLDYSKDRNEIVTLTKNQLVLKHTYSYGGWCIERHKRVSDSVIDGISTK